MAQAPSDPLAGNSRYRKIKDINKGSFGFVVLAENLETRDQVAIKFTRVE
jgi:serine/threonine-protein kinase SRK2